MKSEGFFKGILVRPVVLTCNDSKKCLLLCNNGILQITIKVIILNTVDPVNYIEPLLTDFCALGCML